MDYNLTLSLAGMILCFIFLVSLGAYNSYIE